MGAPAKIFERTVRGMVPHKTARGGTALKRLKAYEGTPPPYDKQKRNVIPSALKVLRLRHGRKFCSVGRLSHEVGWKHQDIIETLEAKRKVKSEAHYKKKIALKKVKEDVLKDPEVAKKIAGYQEIISSYGY